MYSRVKPVYVVGDGSVVDFPTRACGYTMSASAETDPAPWIRPGQGGSLGCLHLSPTALPPERYSTDRGEKKREKIRNDESAFQGSVVADAGIRLACMLVMMPEHSYLIAMSSLFLRSACSVHRLDIQRFPGGS